MSQIVQAFERMRARPLPGALLEFGVWQGDGLANMAQLAGEYLRSPADGRVPPLYGFDTFTGMPSTNVPLVDNHAEVWRPGGYADTTVAEVQRRVPSAIIIPGLFGDLRPLSTYGIQRVRFARLDCDLYESYRDSLSLLTPALMPGSLLLFDEVVPPDDPRYHDSVRDHGEHALREWEAEIGLPLTRLGAWSTELLAEVR